MPPREYYPHKKTKPKHAPNRALSSRKKERRKKMTTQEIHERLDRRAGKKIPIKHLMVLLERFEERTGKKVDERNIGEFLQYAW
jgi:hypothetical protein